MADSLVSVAITADPSDFNAGMANAANAAKGAFAAIQEASRQAAAGMDESFGKAGEQLTKEQQKQVASWIAMFQPVNAAFDRSIAGMIAGTLTWQRAVSHIGQSILAEELNAALKLAERWIVTEAVKTSATEAGAAARGAAEDAANANSLAGLATKAIKAIVGDAAETFAGVFAFLSPELGPAAAGPAAASEALVLGKTAMVMAEGGMWEVPGTILSVLHPEESVIPAAVANPMRDFFSGGVDGAGGDIHIHGPLVSAIDTQTGALFLKNNIRAIARGLAGELRNFNPSLKAPA